MSQTADAADYSNATDSETTDAAANWFANHPRMMGALFTALLLLSSAGNAAANAYTTVAGP